MLADVQTTAPPAAAKWPPRASRQWSGVQSCGSECLRLGRFHVHPGARALLRDRIAVEVGSRAFDLLVRLLRSRGHVVSKPEIIAHVWPAIFVEESNLRFQVAQLRKTLGDHGHLIKTVPGRGYLLAVAESEEEAATVSIGNRTDVRRANGFSGNGGSEPPPSEPDDPGREIGLPRVAMIDPDEDFARSISELLRQQGLDVRTFESAEAFLAAQREDVDCVILDVWLPGLNGLQLQAELATSGALVPFIFVSSHADVDSAVRAMKAGASEFFTKPLRHIDFIDAVRRAVGLEQIQHTGGGGERIG